MIFAQGDPHGNITEPRPFSNPFENEADYAAATRSFVKETTMQSGKVALVTGSTSGIVGALAADGADILLNGFGLAKVAALQRIAKRGSRRSSESARCRSRRCSRSTSWSRSSP